MRMLPLTAPNRDRGLVLVKYEHVVAIGPAIQATMDSPAQAELILTTGDKIQVTQSADEIREMVTQMQLREAHID